MLGASVARARPDLLYAYVGMAQVTGWRSIFIDGRDAMMANARSSGNAELLQRLEKIGPPPSGNAQAFMPWTNEVHAVAFEQGHFWYNARSQWDVMKRVLVWQMYSPTLTLGQVFEPFLGNDGAATFAVRQRWTLLNCKFFPARTPQIPFSRRPRDAAKYRYHTWNTAGPAKRLRRSKLSRIAL